MLEAERQKNAFGRVDDWAVEVLKLLEDDVLTTLIQVCIFLCQNLSRIDCTLLLGVSN